MLLQIVCVSNVVLKWVFTCNVVISSNSSKNVVSSISSNKKSDVALWWCHASIYNPWLIILNYKFNCR